MPDRDVDVKDPAPGITVREPAAQRGPDDRGENHSDAINRHGHAALGRRKTLQQDRLRERLQRPAPGALHHAGHDQQSQTAGGSAKKGEQVKIMMQAIKNRLRPK